MLPFSLRALTVADSGCAASTWSGGSSVSLEAEVNMRRRSDGAFVSSSSSSSKEVVHRGGSSAESLLVRAGEAGLEERCDRATVEESSFTVSISTSWPLAFFLNEGKKRFFFFFLPASGMDAYFFGNRLAK